ncbi:MAG: hypothetical protein Q3990_02245, partial [Desulfovibrionaceae bacterium]|nr:hypothetical protein [Desulfovibrionaceae bacterium]
HVVQPQPNPYDPQIKSRDFRHDARDRWEAENGKIPYSLDEHYPHGNFDNKYDENLLDIPAFVRRNMD